MVARVHVSLALQLKLKTMETLLLVFSGMVWYLFLVAFREVQNCIMEGIRI
jgi:hypothetical protein